MPALRPLPPRPSLEYERKEAKPLLRRPGAGARDVIERFGAFHTRNGIACTATKVLVVATTFVTAHAEALAQTAATLPVWDVVAEPALVIGGEGQPETEFTRIVGVTRLPSGNIVVANAGSLELRVFSSTGGHLKSLGGQGSGPGELRMMTRMFRAGDTLLVLDGLMVGSQLHVFTESGGFLSRMTLRTKSERAAPLRRFAGGRYLSSRAGVRALNLRAGDRVSDSIRLDIFSTGDPGTSVSLGTYSAGLLLAYALPAPAPAPGIVRYPYASQLLYETSGDRLWVGHTRESELTVFDATGRRLPSVSLSVKERPIDQARLDAVMRRNLANATDADERTRIEALREAAFRERVAPLFSRLLAGVDGEIWIELFREDAADPAEFLVLSLEGKAVARVRAPGGVLFHEIGRDYALGVRTDEDGVEHVVMHTLRR